MSLKRQTTCIRCMPRHTQTKRAYTITVSLHHDTHHCIPRWPDRRGVSYGYHLREYGQGYLGHPGYGQAMSLQCMYKVSGCIVAEHPAPNNS
jgi:hypothetical protein